MFNKLDKEILDIAEAAKKVMAKEAEVRPGEKSTEKMVKDHPITKKDDPEQDPKNAKGVEYKIKGMSEGKMKDLHALVSKGVKDPKKITKALGLPDTKEVHKAISSLVAGMKEGLDPVNRKAVTKSFKDRKDKDIDNDGDTDDSDEYLHKRRKAISKATGKAKKEDDRSFNKKKVAEATNYDFLDEASEYILEEGNIDDLSDEQLDEVLKTIATKVGQGIGTVAKAAGKLAGKGIKKAADRLSTSGRADAAEKKADKLDKKRADKERLSKAKDRVRKARDDQKADKERERKAREAERKAAQQDRDDSKNESVELEEKNDALYLIYKDKIKAQQVRNFIKKTYRNKTEVEYAPMDAKNFGVSVFSDRGQADKIKKAVDKKFGKSDDFMLESLDEAFKKWEVVVTKPVNNLKKNQKVVVDARNTVEAIKKAAKKLKINDKLITGKVDVNLKK